MTNFTAKSDRCLAAIIACTAVLLTTSRAIASPEVPGAPQQRPIALVGGTVHTVAGKPIEGGTVLFDKGRIVAVGRDMKIPDDAERIDIAGKHVYPGLIDACSTLGLVEISAVRATVDDNETGRLNPNVAARVAVNPDSEHIPVTRANGVLLSLVAPEGGLLSGLSSVMQLDGWTWEEMTVQPDVALHVRWPTLARVHTWWSEIVEQPKASDLEEALDELHKVFADARAYRDARLAAASGKGPPAPHDVRWESLLPVLDGKRPVVIRADELQQIQSAIAWAMHERIRLVIAGGFDAAPCAALLKEHKIPVIVSGTHRLPLRRSDPPDAPFSLPERLRAAGVKFCIASNDRDGNIRNLPYHAATAAAYGLPADEALKSITLYPAEVLGVADRVGSLAAGRDATLFVADGDILEIATGVNMAYIQGRRVDLSNRHTRLYEKYQEKYRRLEADK